MIDDRTVNGATRERFRKLNEFMDANNVPTDNISMMDLRQWVEDFKDTLDDPSIMAAHVAKVSKERTDAFAKLEMKWFDFGILADFYRLENGIVIQSDRKDIGVRVMASLGFSVGGRFKSDKRGELLQGTHIAVFGSDTEFLDFTSMPQDGNLLSLKHIKSFSDFTNQQQAMAGLQGAAKETLSLKARLDEAQGFALAAYEDQLAGLVREVNEEWKANVDRLGEEGDLEGKTFTVYFKGRHPFESLAKRYRENLGGVPNWKVLCKRHEVGNIYTVVKETDPDKEYLIALGKDDVNHVFAFSFFSKFGKKWINEEQKHIGATDNKKLTAYDLFQVYDKVSAKFGL